MAHWFTHRERGGFPIEKAALGSCDLSVFHVGGEWEWLVRQNGCDVAEGGARSCIDAKRYAEDFARLILESVSDDVELAAALASLGRALGVPRSSSRAA
jgi:hypothetical protein